MDSSAIEHIKNNLSPLFQAEPSVAFVYLYGSRANGNVGPMSDYDFAVFLDEQDVAKRHNVLFRLAATIGNELKSDAIDMHCLNDLYVPELKFRILHDGILLFERGVSRLFVEPRILNEYFDFIYLLRKYHLTQQTT